MNALSTVLMADLDRRVSELAGDPKVRAATLTGERQYISAGADL